MVGMIKEVCQALEPSIKRTETLFPLSIIVQLSKEDTVEEK